MRIERRKFIRALAGAAMMKTVRWNPLHGQALATGAWDQNLSVKEISISGRNVELPVFPSSLRLGGTSPSGETLRFTNLYIERGGKPYIPIMGEFHYARFSCEGWIDELRKIKAGGINTVSTYLFWILHEPKEGKFDWAGRNNLRCFLECCREAGLEVVLRVGPFAHGEMRNGGLPDWLYGKPFSARSNDEGYLECVRRLYKEIGIQAKGMFYRDGGPIIGLQLENEFMAASSPWEVAGVREAPLDWIPRGSDGAEHMMRLKTLAIENGLNAPIFSCTAWGSPVPENEFLPMYGAYGFEPWSINEETRKQPPTYSYLFQNEQGKLRGQEKAKVLGEKESIPFACCEMGGGMQCFYRARFVVPAESVQGIALTKLGSGAAVLGYYMYHGGSNPSGDSVFYNEYDVPKISYDFQAPIREYGQIAQSYRILRPIHMFLKEYGAQLGPMSAILPAGAETISPDNTQNIRCSVRVAGSSGFVFLNNYQDHANMPARKDLRIRVALDSGEVCIPQAGGFGIASGEGAILPFNLVLGGVRIRYVTAQLVTQIENDNMLYVFFFAPQGMQPEFCIEADSVNSCSAFGAVTEKKDNYMFVRGESERPFQIECRRANQYVKLHLLSRADSLRMSLLKLWGRERIVFSDADMAEEAGSMIAWKIGNSEFDAEVFPAPKMLDPSNSIVLPSSPGFAHLHSKLPGWRGGVVSKNIGEGVAQVSVPASCLDGVEDILLQIEYRGDIGNAFLDGVLVADNFSNGELWEIGLKQHRDRLKLSPLVIKIVPRLEGSNVVLDATVPHRERFEGKRIAVIDSIKATPVYRTKIGSKGNTL
jgi:hypothetical protein